MRGAKAAVAVAASIGLLGALGEPAFADEGTEPACLVRAICPDTDAVQLYEGRAVGHDEPSLIFYSRQHGAGSNQTWHLRLPANPTAPAVQDSIDGPIWAFQRSATFWLGLAICDTQAAPEYTDRCTPNSDSNVYNSPDPSSPRYIGKHPGGGYMELQFYPPGWSQAEGCDATRWCVAMTITGYSLDQNTGVANNQDCLNRVGLQPQQFAYLTYSGVAHAPGNPLTGSRDFNPATDLLMDPGDDIVVDVHDTPDGLNITIQDQTSGQTGSMTASIANGFAQVDYAPDAATCSITPYAFHPMFSTSTPRTRLSWSAHSYNVAFSDEIGHWEYCDAVNPDTTCAASGTEPVDFDDFFCFPGSASLNVNVTGCLGDDYDFDGVGYQRGVWPGTDGTSDVALHGTSQLFSSPTFNGGQNYDRVAFETDTPRITASDLPFPWLHCQRFSTDGAGCTVVPGDARFYPIYSSTMVDGQCMWQEGGHRFPDSTYYGVTPNQQYSPLLRLFYPVPGGVSYRYNDFNHTLHSNPCPFGSTG